jgi:hypothetical protein
MITNLSFLGSLVDGAQASRALAVLGSALPDNNTLNKALVRKP